MSPRIGLLIFLVLILVVAGLGLWLFPGESPPDRAETKNDSGYQLRFHECGFDTSWRAEVRCATLKTPSTETLSFQLPVMILKATSAKRRSDPVLYLQGGPGAPAGIDREGVKYWRSWVENAGLKRDLVVLDRRGTGGSRPALDCPEYDDFSREILREDAAFERELEEGGAILRECFARLEASGRFAAEAFGTRASTRDVVGLMTELDYHEWNLIGVSYGSRLALAVAQQLDQRDTPVRVRSLILDSVYPPDQGGLLSWPRVMTQGIERFIRWCQSDSDCAPSERNLSAELDAALEQLKREPLSVSIGFWRERRPGTVVINDHRFLSALFAAINQQRRWPEIPKALKAVQQSDSEALRPLIEPFVNQALDESLSSLTFMAVDCRDHRLGTEEEYQTAVDEHPRFRQFLGPLWEWQSCQWLGSAEQPLAPVGDLSVPTLMLAGELDPITPMAWAEELAEQWPDSQLYRIEDIGHSVIGSKRCVHTSLAGYLDDPRAAWQPACGRRQ